MNSLEEFFESDFNTQREQWENALLKELKVPEIGGKSVKKLLTGAEWPILSLKRESSVLVLSQEKWKKASNTYSFSPTEEQINEDLSHGVKVFFFHQEVPDFLRKHEDIHAFGLNDKGIISGREVHDLGGHMIHELAELGTKLISSAQSQSQKELFVGVFVDSHFFQNIAKIRAARLISQKIVSELGIDKEVKIVALTSYVGWTLYERYSNMLRNEASVASAYIAGADFVQSSGYNILHELETDYSADEHSERSQRMARNTSHILALESMLGVVEDASFGSYHLESLTSYLCEQSWTLMQKALSGHNLKSDAEEAAKQRLQMLKTRRKIISGINDFPDAKERLNVKMKDSSFFRLARSFEELRLRMEEVKKPEVYIALFGDYGALNARLNFAKNYFELLGLKVHDPGHSITDLETFKKEVSSRKEEIIVLCASDENYGLLKDVSVKADKKYLAGKVQIPSWENLFAGQNVFEVLEKLVSEFTGGKS